MKSEIKLHQDIRHPNIIRYYDSMEIDNVVYILLEYAPNHSLFFYIHPVKGLPERLALRFLYQTALAVKYLHECGVLHRDIKPENLLLNDRFEIKVCDFGWSCRIDAETDSRFSICGTYEYMSPEIISRIAHGKKTDIWCLGILMFEMIYGKPPFKARNFATMKQQFENRVIFLDSRLSPDTRDLMDNMLNKNAEQRYNIDQVLSHFALTSRRHEIFGPIREEDQKLLAANYHLTTGGARRDLIKEIDQILNKTYDVPPPPRPLAHTHSQLFGPLPNGSLNTISNQMSEKVASAKKFINAGGESSIFSRTSDPLPFTPGRNGQSTYNQYTSNGVENVQHQQQIEPPGLGLKKPPKTGQTRYIKLHEYHKMMETERDSPPTDPEERHEFVPRSEFASLYQNPEMPILSPSALFPKTHVLNTRYVTGDALSGKRANVNQIQQRPNLVHQEAPKEVQPARNGFAFRANGNFGDQSGRGTMNSSLPTLFALSLGQEPTNVPYVHKNGALNGYAGYMTIPALQTPTMNSERTLLSADTLNAPPHTQIERIHLKTLTRFYQPESLTVRGVEHFAQPPTLPRSFSNGNLRPELAFRSDPPRLTQPNIASAKMTSQEARLEAKRMKARVIDIAMQQTSHSSTNRSVWTTMTNDQSHLLRKINSHQFERMNLSSG